MASAYDVIRNQTSGEPVSFAEYHTARMNNKFGKNYDVWNPTDLGSRIDNFFTGNTDRSLQEYNNYLTKLSNAKTFEREDTAVQRAVKDIEAAGLNPWLALNGGAFSGTSASSHSGYQELSDKKSNSKDGANLLGSALKILLLLAMMA